MTPEAPDFNLIAIQVLVNLDSLSTDVVTMRAITDLITEQLRLVWNARGAADLEALRHEVPVIQADVLEETITALHR
jgi:hypothetical protein